MIKTYLNNFKSILKITRCLIGESWFLAAADEFPALWAPPSPCCAGATARRCSASRRGSRPWWSDAGRLAGDTNQVMGGLIMLFSLLVLILIRVCW